MNKLLDISIKKEKIRPKGRPSNYGDSFLKWPRKYGKKIEDAVKDKNWELRNYLPKVN